MIVLTIYELVLLRIFGYIAQAVGIFTNLSHRKIYGYVTKVAAYPRADRTLAATFALLISIPTVLLFFFGIADLGVYLMLRLLHFILIFVILIHIFPVRHLSSAVLPVYVFLVAGILYPGAVFSFLAAGYAISILLLSVRFRYRPLPGRL